MRDEPRTANGNDPSSSYRVGIDVGGTFTDFVVVDANGRVVEAKTPSTPESPGDAMRTGLEELAEKHNREVAAFVKDCSLMIIGSTVALNTLIQRRGAKTGLICTDGFRDTLEIRLGYRDVRQDIRRLPPTPLVPRSLRLPVRERVDKSGRITQPLNELDVRKAIDVFKEEGVQAIAVCLLWSFLEPAHERRVGEILLDAFPDSYHTLSVDVAPQIREYDRTSTTVLNAYVGPRLVTYVEQTEEFLRELGFEGEIRYTQSNGGLAGGNSLRSRAVLALNSGPAAAPAAALFFGRRLGTDSLITADMGGTSFDACLIERGVPDVTGSTDVHCYRLATPMVRINAIGAGGGSVAWIDHGILRVGPQSAEVVPGPACYMRGGSQPTVTDADLVLGYLNQEALLGGKFKVDPSLARAAIENVIGRPLGLALSEAALAIFEIVNRNMANAISEISLERGYDPRNFCIVAAGGQGPLHAAELARELAIPTIIVPRFASTFCAFGALAADLRHDYKRSFTHRLADADVPALEGIFREMEAQGCDELEREGCERGQMKVDRRLEMRYAGQIFDVVVDVTDLPLDGDAADAADALQELLHREHERQYTYRLDDEPGDIINVGVTVVGRLSEMQLPETTRASVDPEKARIMERPMLFRGFDGYRPVAVYDGTILNPGNIVVGPSVVEEPNTTILVPPGFEMELTTVSAYILRRVA